MIAVWLAVIFCFGFALPIASGWRRRRKPDRLADLRYEGRPPSRARPPARYAWREAQVPDALLDLDIRALFGERLSAWIGSELTARLAMRRDVAKARVVAPKKSSPGAPS